MRFGRQSPVISEFGFTPKPRRALTTAEKAIAQAKAALTRKARGTKGKRQRLAIKAVPEPQLLVVGPDGQPLGPAKKK